MTISVTTDLDHFTIDMPAGITAGVSFPVTIQARNQAGEVLAEFDGTIDLTTSDGQASLPLQATFSAGVATFNATLKTAGAQTITASDSMLPLIQIEGSTVVAPAAASQLVFQQRALRWSRLRFLAGDRWPAICPATSRRVTPTRYHRLRRP